MKETEVKLLSLIDGKLQENQTNAIKMYAQVFKFKNIFSLMFVLYTLIKVTQNHGNEDMLR